jgi:hypothetical protein
MSWLPPTNKVHIYIEYHSVCPLVGIGTLPPPSLASLALCLTVPPPLPSIRCLSFLVFLCVAGRACLCGGRGWVRSQVRRLRESLVLYKPFNTLRTMGFLYLFLFYAHAVSLAASNLVDWLISKEVTCCYPR